MEGDTKGLDLADNRMGVSFAVGAEPPSSYSLAIA